MHGEVVQTVIAQPLGERADGRTGEPDEHGPGWLSQTPERDSGGGPTHQKDRGGPFQGARSGHSPERRDSVLVLAPPRAGRFTDGVAPPAYEVSDRRIGSGQKCATETPERGRVSSAKIILSCCAAIIPPNPPTE